MCHHHIWSFGLTIAELKDDLKRMIVETLMLEDVEPGDIEDETPLFNDGLDLDSIDALELGMAISKKYKIKINQDQEKNREYFANVTNLAQYVFEQVKVQNEVAEGAVE